MKEIEVWEYVLKWGLTQNPTLILDPVTWTDDDFKAMKITLQNCLPLIRFFCLSSKEFLYKVRPYQKLLNNQLYEDLLKFYLDSDFVSSYNNLSPRKIVSQSSPLENTAQIIDSQIVDSNIVSTISNWIDKTVENKFAHINEYKFELLLRGSRDGFTPKKFHELCDGKNNTVTFIKIKGIEEIIGGYNPLKWESSDTWGKTKESFIFSFKNKNIKDAIISNIENIDRALAYHPEHGPCFGNDMAMFSSGNQDTDYDEIYCQKNRYEKKIRDSEDNFSIEDYEIFQITRL
jgi:hypothetical protein